MSSSTPLCLWLVIIIAFFSSPSLAYKSCSSLENVLSTTKTLTRFSDECILYHSDSFKASLPLILPSGQPLFSNAILDLVGLEHQIQLSFSTKSQESSFTVKVTNGATQQDYLIPKTSTSLIIEVIEGLFLISFIDSEFEYSYKLNSSSLYTFTIQTSAGNPSFQGSTTKSSSSVLRSLLQCPDGFFLIDGNCERICPSNYYRSQGLCLECPNICNGNPCISETKCNPCRDDEVYWEQSGTCHEKCPETYFQDTHNNICVKCADGCVSCSYPNGQCNVNFLNTDIAITITVSAVLLFLIIICACCWNKNKKEEQAKEEQPEQEGDQDRPSKGKPNSNHINKMMGGAPAGPYNVLPENFENEEELEEDEFQGRRKKKRLTDFAQSKLLTLSMSKPFEVDDSNEEKAISHGSPLLVATRNSSVGTMGTIISRADSPLIFRRRKSTKKHSRFTAKSGSRSEIELNVNIDQTMPSPPIQTSQREASPVNSILTNTGTDALSFLCLKNCAAELSPGLPKHPLDSNREEAENVKTVEEAEEAEEREEVEETGDDEETEKKEGYKSDNSLSMSKDNDDLASCTICGMNKRDCVNRPCGHIVGCYACMEQFRESYAVCPRCKLLLTKLEKVALKKKKK